MCLGTIKVFDVARDEGDLVGGELGRKLILRDFSDWKLYDQIWVVDGLLKWQVREPTVERLDTDTQFRTCIS